MKNILSERKLWIQLAFLLFIALFAYNFLNEPQCPSHYTQAQVDETGCSDGANIGLWVALIILAPALLTSLGLIIYSAYKRTKKS